jgi:UDP-N-acetylmuramoylalanine--D-glutamate ligase
MVLVTETDNTMETLLDKFKDMNVTVVGCAKSGTGAANLLSVLGAKVCVTDSRALDILNDAVRKLLPSITVKAGGHPEELFDSTDLIVVSPGVPIDIKPLSRARKRGIPIIGELELAYQVVNASQPLAPSFIGVTGTNGKSTTITLIDHMLRLSGRETLLGGNIGNALTEELYNRETVAGEFKVDYIVAEVSSFQLETISSFKPFIALILNISPDHLDRYAGMHEYIAAKARIFENQGVSDFLILNADDLVVMDLYRTESVKQGSRLNSVKVLFFSKTREVEGIYHKDGVLYLQSLSTSRAAPSAFLRKQEEGAAPSPIHIIAREEIKIKGNHNLENAMAATLAAVIAGCSLESIRVVLREFGGLEHRLEFVREIRGVKFINDSKGTNIGATARSLEGLQNVILIMGGRDKGGDFSVLKQIIKKKVKVLLLYGEAKEKIARETGGITDTIFVSDLREAVESALARAWSGDTVLLSPGCTSFDMFADFEERGKMFKEEVLRIEG